MVWSLGFDPQDARQKLHPWILTNGMELVLDLSKSRGQYLYDALSGEELLDVFGFFASRPLAFNHPKYQDPDFLEALRFTALHKPSNCDVYTPEYAAFIDKFARTALEERFAHVFVIEGGSPAVENAIKAAIDWKFRKNIAAGRGEHGTQIIHFKQCFHGRTGYCLSLTDSYDPRKTQWFPKFDWPRIDNPYVHFPINDAELERVAKAEQEALAQIDAAIAERAPDIAAILCEPIQGEGGDNYFRSEFLQALRQRCDQHELMLIFDEVQTGFGSTGAWWDHLHHNVMPDLVVFGKKTQVCGFAASSRIDEVDGVFKTGSRISSTFEGGLTDMLRCFRVMQIIEEDRLIDNAQEAGQSLLEHLTRLSDAFSIASAPRGRGLWGALSFPSTDLRNQVIAAALGEKLLVIPSGTHSIRCRPALDIDLDTLNEAMTRFERALSKVEA